MSEKRHQGITILNKENEKMTALANKIELTAVDAMTKIQIAMSTNQITWPIVAVVIATDSILRLCTGHGVLK